MRQYVGQAVIALSLIAGVAHAQVGKSLGVVDANTASEQVLWARLSVFAGGFDLPAVEEVCSAEDLAREEVFEVIASLLDKSIVLRTGHGFAARYQMLATLREYGQRQLDAAAGEQARLRRQRARQRHALLLAA